MNPIRLPRAAVQLAGVADAALVQIEQQAAGVVFTVAAGERVLRLAATADAALATVQPFTISAIDFTRAGEAVGAAGPGQAGELPLVVVRISAEVAGIAGPAGTPQTVAIMQTAFPDCSGCIDRAEGERASGMTRAVAAADPRHLLELAEAAVAIGCTAVQFTFAPRFGLVLAEAEASGIAATVVLAGEKPEQIESVASATADDDPLVFTMAGSKPRRTARGSTSKPKPLACEADLPW